MKRAFRWPAAWLQVLTMNVLLSGIVLASTGEVIDRIVATVNKTAILQSDLETELRYEAFVDRRPLETLTQADAHATLQRLVDQELLRIEMKAAGFHVREQRVAQRIRDIRKQYPEAQTEEGWRAALARYGLSEAEFQDRVMAQMEILRFVDTRLRPNVHIDGGAIEDYYRNKLLPQVHQAGGGDVPLAQVRDKIEEVLVQQRIDELLTAWLNSLRQQSTIHTELPVYGPISAAEVPPGGAARDAKGGGEAYQDTGKKITDRR